MKEYCVSVDIKHIDDYIIRAKNKAEAKRKAIDKFRNRKSNFEADAYLENEY